MSKNFVQFFWLVGVAIYPRTPLIGLVSINFTRASTVNSNRAISTFKKVDPVNEVKYESSYLSKENLEEFNKWRNSPTFFSDPLNLGPEILKKFAKKPPQKRKLMNRNKGRKHFKVNLPKKTLYKKIVGVAQLSVVQIKNLSVYLSGRGFSDSLRPAIALMRRRRFKVSAQKMRLLKKLQLKKRWPNVSAQKMRLLKKLQLKKRRLKKNLPHKQLKKRNKWFRGDVYFRGSHPVAQYFYFIKSGLSFKQGLRIKKPRPVPTGKKKIFNRKPIIEPVLKSVNDSLFLRFIKKPKHVPGVKKKYLIENPSLTRY